MKKLLLVLMITAVVLTSCKKNEAPQADQAKGEIEFNVTNIMDDGSRTVIPGIPDCDLEAIPSHAIVSITTDLAGTIPIPGSPFTMNISEVGGDLLTDVLKLVPGTYYVTQFDVYDGTNLIWAAPAAGSFYNDFMTIKLNLEFTVVAYQKSGFEIEVLCYEETIADQFGFTWFDLDKVVLRDICLFGDICLTQFPGIENWGDGGYSGEFDMPAQFQVSLYRAGATVPLSVYQNYDNNLDTYRADIPLCIQYPDALEIPDEAFELVLEVYQPDGFGGFGLYQWYTFTWEDDATVAPGLNFGDDNVIDFYIGHCYNPATPPDYAFPTLVVTQSDLATSSPAQLGEWFYYDDSDDGTGSDVGIFPPDNPFPGYNIFTAGPGTPPVGTGVAQIKVPKWDVIPSPGSKYQPQYALATRQFAGVPLALITEMKYSYYYDPANTLAKPVINFNISFDGIDGWQGRLTYAIPTPTATTAQWITLDVLTEGLWYKSGGTNWPAPNGSWTTGKTWTEVTTGYTSATMRLTDSWFGFRVDDNQNSINTQYVDKFIFGVNNTSVTYDFEP